MSPCALSPSKRFAAFGNSIPMPSKPSRRGIVTPSGPSWNTPADIKNVYRNASFVGNNRVVFNIRGNQYRLVVAINYTSGIIYIRFIGTHQDYDKIDVATI
jgi:mRNA interferase HigB